MLWHGGGPPTRGSSHHRMPATTPGDGGTLRRAAPVIPHNSSYVFCAFGVPEGRPLARAQDRLLGPCFKTGPGGTSILPLPIDSPRGPLREGRRCTLESITRPTANTTCSKPQLAAQAFGTERRYGGASNRHQGATVGRPCVSRRRSCFVMDRNVLV